MKKEKFLHNYNILISPFTTSGDLTTGRINVTGEVAHFGEEIAKIEGFLRLLWAEAFNIDGREKEYFKNLCQGILNGTDKNSKHFWGDIPDYGQLFVEMVALSVFLIESKTYFWDKLTNAEQIQIASYMNQITDANITLNNWQFFKVMVQVAFYKLGVSFFTKEGLDNSIAIVNSYYLDEGFYTDGNTTSKDYYISWAFHYYGLLYDRYMSEFDPETSAIFIERAQLYLSAYLAHFDSDGIAVAYGRSLAYRFAQGALLSMVALTGKIDVDFNLLGSLLLGHISYWMNQEITKPDGSLAVGYAYPNVIMAENYNSAGSAYWAFKYFALLGCDKDHPVFDATPTSLPLGRKAFKTGNFIAETTADQTFFYPINNTATTDGYKDKYNKFVYSTKFAFSVSKGILHLDEGAFDNTLAIKDPDTGLFLTKLTEENFEIFEDQLVFTWSPKQGICIKSTIIPKGNEHQRIHEITTDKQMEIFDMGFANDALKAEETLVTKTEKSATITTPYGVIGSKSIKGYDEALVVNTTPSTHLLFKKAALTGLKATVFPGNHRFESSHNASYRKED